MSYASAAHDRMIAALIMNVYVVAVDLTSSPPMCRVSDGDWVSAWIRWHSLAAGKARHWRAPTLGEQGAVLSPSGDPAQGTFIPGLYGNAGAPPDNRDHVEVWRFDDGGSLVYDWQAKSYTVNLPTGTVTVKVGASTVVVTDDSATVQSPSINLTGNVKIDGALLVTGNVTGMGTILDTLGNSNHHNH
ncbi:phage baseplate assembly protein V [Pseudomonas fragariae (ex Marin et al. 2024)]|uniref:Phage baseplate assembly protein V n=2 Tax=Pseudomonas fragariae (ex Marin et al. 2024) TaxID=3080056 RepID=A0ABT3LPA2_9PSED|nr:MULTISPECIES: phage baseplate assembly protein V [unclassified Pseudomonas]MCW6058242.1 phage baseplate assembly protein V [Pseudomonas fragi]MDV0428337.1 phage baseplate assembly protein V [Pseudomonas sp. 17]MDX9573981.1 phage baseplate assembly protein V [Pseudomonas sp. 21(2023)]MDX9586803.1 phage baseplate assembly protein V [Pseudomonas sp. 19(2023)]MDY6478673.1 phage baseplate assembly protein V [Pseudomonas sp. 18]